MRWFVDHLHIRMEPRLIDPAAKSVLVLGAPYRSVEYERLIEGSAFKISNYAAGRDYHKALRKRMRRLLSEIARIAPNVTGRIAVDSAPVPEKVLARNAGAGWIGKHTNLIHPRIGSYIFLGVIFLNIEIEPDAPMESRCGSCNLCFKACPTGAIGDYRIDPRRCISYLTIESRSVEESFRGKLGGWIFGCDICQSVCPYNRRERSLAVAPFAEFHPRPEIIDLLSDLNGSPNGGEAAESILTEERFEVVATGSPIRRAGRERLLRSIAMQIR
jgi:epoxyqueuosine reductase